MVEKTNANKLSTPPPPSDSFDMTRVVPGISLGEISVQCMLGSGSYAAAYKVKCYEWGERGAAKEGTSSDGLQPPSLDSTGGSSCLSSDNDDQCYALKKLRQRTLCCAKKRDAAAKDMLKEASLLSKLPLHANIVRLHAVSDGFWSNPAEGFLVLGHLVETLEAKISNWRKSGHRKTQQRICDAGIPLARAIAFLHHHNICYRDLKPENVGFDRSGNLRLFDFGFAIELTRGEVLTGRVGTPRYMAPEVLKRQNYGTPADVYSLSCLLWEIVMLRKPYQYARDYNELHEMVALDAVRPSVWTIWSKDIRTILTAGWQQSAEQRPTAREMERSLCRACNVPEEPISPSCSISRSESFSRQRAQSTRSSFVAHAA